MGLKWNFFSPAGLNFGANLVGNSGTSRQLRGLVRVLEMLISGC